jgi:hypothetical protein
VPVKGGYQISRAPHCTARGEFDCVVLLDLVDPIAGPILAYVWLWSDAAGRTERARNNSLEIDNIATAVAVQVPRSARDNAQCRVNFDLHVEHINDAVVVEIAGGGLGGVRNHHEHGVVHRLKVRAQHIAKSREVAVVPARVGGS